MAAPLRSQTPWQLEQLRRNPELVPPFRIEPGDSVTVFEIPAASRAYVELKGSVYHPGRYGWRPGMRLSELIELAGGFRPAIYTGRAHIERLNHVDSTRYLMEFALPEDSTAPDPSDLALGEYDIVTIYAREELRAARKVSIAGMVGDGTLATRLRVPMDSTYLFVPDSSSYPRLPGRAAASHRAPKVTLETFDQVKVFRQPELELLRKVTIGGEVWFAGTYALMRQDERVSDLVRRSDGLLPTAYADGARFIRRIGGTGRAKLELARVLASPGGLDDIILQPADSLVIPEYLPTVRVEGAVNTPTSVLYARGADLEYYIGNAGGYAPNADKGPVSVRYASGATEVKGRFLFFTSSPKPGPGSLVMVPEEGQAEPLHVTQLFGTIAQILVSAVVIIAIVQ